MNQRNASSPDGLTRTERDQVPGKAAARGRSAVGHPWLNAAIGALVVAFTVSTVVGVKRVDGYSTLWDGWVYTIAETLPMVPMLIRARRSDFRLAWISIAVMVALHSIGDVVYTFHDQNLVPVPSPAISDGFYLAAYVAFAVGVASLTQSSFGRIHASIRLDGLITGMTVAAVVVRLWFGPLLHVSGRPLSMAVNLAYPSADVVLIILLVAGLAPNRYRPNWPTALLMAGVAWWVVGDVVFLNRVETNSYVSGTPLDSTWLVGLLLMGVAASIVDRRRSGGPRRQTGIPGGLATIPVIAAFADLAVVAASAHDGASPVALWIGIASLALVVGRMWMTVQEVRQSAANYLDARTDSLTGLANRRAFQERLESLIEREDRPVGGAGVLLIDIDGFKEVNDALGHTIGDELLCLVARRFERRVPSGATLARLGGDEFACALGTNRQEDLLSAAAALAESLRDPFILDGMSVVIAASIGVSLSGEEVSTATEALRCADVAMYEAKRLSSEVEVYRADSDFHTRERLALLDALRDAISSRTLTLHYQPTLDMHTGQVRGVEALARWHHPQLGLLYPDSFIPIAERHGLMPRLTRAVVDQAVAHAVHLDSNGHELQMSVNISRYDLVDEGFGDYIESVLAKYGFPAERLTLEITETALASDFDRIEKCIVQLRSRGLKISIDDFGVGYSSMSQLLGLAIDELKIDRSFVMNIGTDSRSLAIVRSSVELARALGLTVVAEGIEQKDVLQILQGIGTDVGQGYVIARPLDSERLDAYLEEDDEEEPLLVPLAAAS